MMDLRALFILWLLLLPYPLQAASQAQMERFFEEVVFQSEYKEVAAPQRLSKWPSGHAVTLAIHGTPKKEQLEWTKVHLTRISNLTGLAFKHLKGQEKGSAGLHLFYVERSQMANLKLPGVSQPLLQTLVKHGVCFFITAKNSRSEIIRGYVVIDRNGPDRGVDNCILEELNQVMGLPNDSDAVRPSIFNNQCSMSQPSLQDSFLLRALYDPRMQVGLSKDEAMTQFRAILKSGPIKRPLW
ncbi:DUF2927 domain-containing protein [Magnetococcus marinus]|nr:DUF2927 domain-containing protein [Magnetococcus marinus]